jgi:ABC-type antimicrobial peptide transport system permease subunit
MEPFDEGEGASWFQVVGVVGRMKFHGFDNSAPLPNAYFSLDQVKRTSQVLFVRAGSHAGALGKSVRDIVAAIDPAQPVFDVRTMQERVEATWAAHRLLAFLLGIFSLLALGLATIGLFGVISYTSFRRLREIGVRIALGAQRFQIRNLMLVHGIKLLALGVALGLAGAVAVSRLLRSVLFQVQPADFQIYLGVGAILTVATLAASWLPAWRASRVNPLITLRAE